MRPEPIEPAYTDYMTKDELKASNTRKYWSIAYPGAMRVMKLMY